MNKKLSVIALSFLIGASHSATQAADRSGAFFVRPALSYYFPASKRQIENAGAAGLSLGYDISDRLGAAIGATVINTDQDSNIGGSHVHGFLYTLDGIYRLEPVQGFTPYVMGGPQITSLKPATGSDPVTMAGASLGIGAGYYFSNSVGMSAEARDLYTFSGGKNDLLFSVGVNFLLGGY